MLNQRFPTVTAGLATFETDPLVAPPGTRFSYSSYGFNLISAARPHSAWIAIRGS